MPHSYLTSIAMRLAKSRLIEAVEEIYAVEDAGLVGGRLSSIAVYQLE
jgi:hypothetical protein